MTILGIGCDMLFIPRLSKLYSYPVRFNAIARKIMHPTEYENFQALLKAKDKALTIQYFSSIWSCKEAYYKALTYNEQIETPFFQICRQFYKVNDVYQNNRPVIINPSDYEKNIKIHITLSHDGDYVTTYIVREI